MYRFLVIVLLIDAVVLAAAVLLQSGKGGGLAASFGGAGSSPNSLLGSREAGNLLTKASWWAGGIFIALAYVLQLMVTHAGAPSSVLDTEFQQRQKQAAPTAPSTNQPTAPLQPVVPPPSGDAGKKAPAGKQPPGKQP